jgi:hypothetical protein
MKDFWLAVFYDEAKEHCHMVVTRQDHEVAGRLLAREANRLGVYWADEKIANADSPCGPATSWNCMGWWIAWDWTSIISARTCKGSLGGLRRGNPGGAPVGQDADALLQARRLSGCLAAIDRVRSGLRRANREAADTLLHYVAERREMIRYPEFLRHGWQIGSGPTEAQCKTTTMWVKGLGKRRDTNHAEAVIALACLDNSRGWSHYWLTPDRSPN